MEKPISVGDLVVVVRPCCDAQAGHIFKVGEIARGTFRCISCFYEGSSGLAIEGWGPNMKSGFLHELKRLDPDALKDDVPADEKLREPA